MWIYVMALLAARAKAVQQAREADVRRSGTLDGRARSTCKGYTSEGLARENAKVQMRQIKSSRA